MRLGYIAGVDGGLQTRVVSHKDIASCELGLSVLTQKKSQNVVFLVVA